MQAMALAFIGGAIGLADSWIRPVTGAAPPRTSRAELLGDDDVEADTTGATSATTTATPDEVKPADPPTTTTPAETPQQQADAQPQPTPPQAQEPAATPAQPDPEWLAWDTRQDNWPENYITVAEARRLIDRRQAQLIDARRADEYEQGHIPGALRLNLEFFRSGEALDRLLEAGFDPEAVTIVYCGGGECDESNRVAEELGFLSFPFRDVFVIKAGIAGWAGRGMPVETGPGGY